MATHTTSGKSNLDIVNECDNFPYGQNETELRSTYYFFHLRDYGDTVLGYIPTFIAEKLPIDERHWTLDRDRRRLIFHPQNQDGSAAKTVEQRDAVMAIYLQSVRQQKIFEVLAGWRNELYPVYGPDRKLLFSMERSASPLFGIVTYGVHMTAFSRTDEGLKLWTPRRALTKPTYPGMMDNTVAGGISTGEKPFECVVREADEEASLPESVARNVKVCGTLTYFHVRDARAQGETGLCQPECQFIYDLELTSDVIPKPKDGESMDFQLMTVTETQQAIAAGQFKPNCALLLLEFFVRHGILTPDNEPHYMEILPRLHRKLDFPMGIE